jgi:hypothetical protein
MRHQQLRTPINIAQILGSFDRDCHHLHYIQSTVERERSDYKQLQHCYVIIWVSYIINLVGELIKFCWLVAHYIGDHHFGGTKRVGDGTIEFH